MELDPEAIQLKVGLEVHQQLATRHKLFCPCPPAGEDREERSFYRRLRPSASELGEVDPAALFEFRRGVGISYHAGDATSCLVEADEEPPHELNPEAVEIAVLIALSLNSIVVDEIHTMRKIVIDGSNTTGFQRTLIVAMGGELRVNGRRVPVQTICLEEDAARILGQEGRLKHYGLDRLGIPLVEVALAPITASPREVREVALALGRLMRATRRVARGLGTVRQDVNISVMGGRVVEVKGVQQLDLLEKVVEYEAQRQMALHQLAQELRKRPIEPQRLGKTVVEVSDLLKATGCKPIQRTLKAGGTVLAVKLEGFAGMLGYEPQPGIRLGREMAEMVRFYGLGGLLHSDELPGMGVSEQEVEAIAARLGAGKEDAFILLAGPRDMVAEAARAVVERAREALDGVPYETRAPTPDGRTRYLRPRPGAARMYPETDIPPFPISSELLERLRRAVPKPWEEQVREYQAKYGLSLKLATQIYDSDWLELFEELAATTKVAPSFIAATLTETLVSLEREGLDVTRVTGEVLRELFKAIDRGQLSKEAAPDILELVARGEAKSVAEAQDKLGLKPLEMEELEGLLTRLVKDAEAMVEARGERAFGPLMGQAMKQLRGRVDGETVSRLLKKKIQELLQAKAK